MFVAVAIAFPVVLLLAVLGMERVEHRLGRRPATAAAHAVGPSRTHPPAHTPASSAPAPAAGASRTPSEPERAP